MSGRLPRPAPDTFTVRQLNQLIRHALSLTFPDEVWVEGEIASLRRHAASGNVYFQLVDPGDESPAAAGGPSSSQAEAALAVVLHRANKEAVNRLLRRARPAPAADHPPAAAADATAEPIAPAIRMADGVHIRIRGGLEFLPRSGRLQLRMTSIDPAHTLGRLAAERDRVLATLAAEGLLGRNGALAFPLLPTRLGLVTSGGSAAQADFLHELRPDADGRAGDGGRGVGWRITAVHTRVQGPGADDEMAAALRALERHGVEVIALVRGGGARTDLFAFDSEVLARAIAGAGVPVVTGIGHEIDSSVADRVAAKAFKTPTACAAALAERARRAVDRPEAAWAGVRARASDLVDQRSRSLQRTGRRLAFASRVRLDGHAARIIEDERRLRAGATGAVTGAERRLAALAGRAEAVDPARALARGWSITRTAGGRLVRDPADAAPGTELVSTVAGGEVRSRVEGPPAGEGGT
jgi:exodeoxyribonuclease VII large subunit